MTTALFNRHLLYVAAAAVLAYAVTILNGFAWDDIVVIAKNPALTGHPAALFSGLDTAADAEITPYYRPLPLLTFLAEQRIHGLTPAFMHLANILLHGVNALLLYALVTEISKNRETALFAALLFAVHPLNSEGVAFLSGGRNTLLATGFCLSAYLLNEKSRGGRWYLLPVAALLVTAALLSKESALAILPILCLAELRHRSGLGRIWPVAGRIVWYAVSVALYLRLRTTALAAAGYSGDILPGMLSRLADNLYMIPRYLLTIIWPPFSSVRYFIPETFHTLALPLAAAWLGILLTLGWLLSRNRDNMTLFGLVWLLSFWIPTSGIIPFPSASMADRYLYLPAIGLWIIVAQQFGRLVQRSRRPGPALAAGGLMLVLLAGLTVQRAMVWKNDVTLFSDYVEHFPDRAFGHHNLGTAYLDIEKAPVKAEAEFRKVLLLDPAFPKLHTQLGYLRLLRGDLQGALTEYNEAVSLYPQDAEALLNRGDILAGMGKYSEAVSSYLRFLTAPDREFDTVRPAVTQKILVLQQTAAPPPPGQAP